MTNAHILIIDDDQDILTAGKLLLKRSFSNVTAIDNPQDIYGVQREGNIDVYLLDMNFGPGKSSGQEGIDWLRTIKDNDPDAVVVMITAHGGVRTAVEAMKHGASDFITKPWQNEKLVATVSAAADLSRSRREATSLKSRTTALARGSSKAGQPILGKSKGMLQVFDIIERAAPTDANILILGENGTGKELVARAIHRKSQRADAAFMSVDLGAVPETLFESELFGHKKGAFTGAAVDRTGLIEAASGGTLFLDEIGNLPLHLQGKLLTVLEQRQVTPLGSTKSRAFDVRVVAATNMPSDKLHNPNNFRTDLLFRLNTVEISLPALRERAEDIPEIAEHYIAYYERKYARAQKRISKEAMAALKNNHWPGNARALRHAAERAVIMAQGQAYEPHDFSLPNQQDNTSDISSPQEDLNLERIEKQSIAIALKKHEYNISKTARELGLTRATLYRRLEKHGL